VSLQIIYGKAGSGKTYICFERIKKILENENSDIIYLVPEQFSLQSEIKINKMLKNSSVARIDILSFERLASRTFSNVGPVCLQYIDDIGKQMIIQKILISLEKKLTVLSKAVKIDDFTAIVLEIITEFKRYNVSPQMLRESADKIDLAMLKFKLLDIALIYEAFIDEFNMPLADANDNMTVLCDKIIRHNLYKNTHIIIDGFTSFAPNQFAVIDALLKNCLSTAVVLTTDSLEEPRDFDVFQAAKHTAKRLFEIAFDNNIEILPNVFADTCKKYKENTELYHLSENYFKYPHSCFFEPTKNISIFTANNYYGEISAIATEIIRLCRVEKYRFRDIAVITRNTEGYYPLIKHIFGEYNINAYIDEKFSAIKHSFAKAIFSVLEIVNSNWNFESLFSFLKSEYSYISFEKVNLIENYLLAVCYNARMWKSDADWTFGGGFDDEQMVLINQIKNEIREPIIKFIDKFKGRKTVLQIAAAVTEFLFDIKIDEVIEKKAVYLEQCGKIMESNALVNVYNCVIGTINQMVSILGDEYITFEKFYSVLKSGILATDVGQVPATVDEVLVCNIDRFKGQDVKCVFIAGVSDGVFPRGHIGEGILSDSDREMLLNFDVEIAKGTAAMQQDENYLIYSSLTAPSEKLYLYYPMADNEGKGLFPSSIINRVKKIFTNVKTEDNIYIKTNDLPYIEGVIPTFNKMIQHGGSGIWPQVRQWFLENRLDLYEKVQGAYSYTNIPKNLGRDIVENLYGTVLSSSVSKIEQFNKCQFAYFLKYGLRAKPRKEFKIEPADAGTFMHEIIEVFSKYASEIGWERVDKEDTKAKISLITDEVIEKYLGQEYSENPRLFYLTSKIKNIMTTTVWNIAEFYKKSDFIPLGYEIGFGDGADFPSIEVPLESGDVVKLVGKVDRADIWKTDTGDFINIVDYKSSSRDVNFAEILCGVQIQLPTYIDAICKSLSKKEGVQAIPSAMLYYRIDDPIITADKNITDEQIWEQVQKNLKMRGLMLEGNYRGLSSAFFVKSEVTAKQIDRICSVAYKKVKGALDDIINGNIKINPVRVSGKTSCEWCDFAAVCQFDEAVSGNSFRNMRKINREEFFEYVNKMD